MCVLVLRYLPLSAVAIPCGLDGHGFFACLDVVLVRPLWATHGLQRHSCALFHLIMHKHCNACRAEQACSCCCRIDVTNSSQLRCTVNRRTARPSESQSESSDSLPLSARTATKLYLQTGGDEEREETESKATRARERGRERLSGGGNPNRARAPRLAGQTRLLYRRPAQSQCLPTGHPPPEGGRSMELRLYQRAD